MVTLNPKVFVVMNFIAFQSVWLLAVKLQNDGFLWLSLILFSHFLFSQHLARDLLTIICITFVGCLVDSAASHFSIFYFAHDSLLPFWLIILWSYFSLTFHYSMSWLARFPVALQGVLGGVFGSLSYYSAYLLGAVDFPQGEQHTVFYLVVIWSLTLPVYVFIANTLAGKLNEKSNLISSIIKFSTPEKS